LVATGIIGNYSFTRFDGFIGVDVNLMAELSIFGCSIARYLEFGTKYLYNNEIQLFCLPRMKAFVDWQSSELVAEVTPFVNEFGQESQFDKDSAAWAVFQPEAKLLSGMKVNMENDLNLNRAYFVGNSVMLGEIGKQYVDVCIVPNEVTGCDPVRYDVPID